MKNLKKMHLSIKNWANDDQPTYKLIKKGAENLSNAELLGILFRTGTKNLSAVELGREVLKTSHDNLNELARIGISELQKIKGIGETKAVIIAAALEFGRRRQATAFLKKPIIKSSKDVADYLQNTLQDLNHEVFAVVYLNRANKIIHFEIISRGGITGTVADPRMILRIALEHGSTSIILCHNHPSGNLQPSKADELITKKIIQSGEIIDIKILDHIIVSNEGYYSFLDEGMI